MELDFLVICLGVFGHLGSPRSEAREGEGSIVELLGVILGVQGLSGRSGLQAAQGTRMQLLWILLWFWGVSTRRGGPRGAARRGLPIPSLKGRQQMLRPTPCQALTGKGLGPGVTRAHDLSWGPEQTLDKKSVTMNP